jgi:fumarate reductase subunit D
VAIGLLQAGIVWAMMVECVLCCVGLLLCRLGVLDSGKLARRVSRNACAKVPELLVLGGACFLFRFESDLAEARPQVKCRSHMSTW